jgi:glycosyltransferase involved in cell wall biosynthesis
VKHADVATAVARSQAEALSRRYGRPVRYIPNGVDADAAIDQAAAARFLSEIGLEPGRYAMFAAARVDPTKGCLTLIEAWRELGCPMPLLVLGDLWHAPGHESELRDAAEGMDVHFVPRIDHKPTLAGLVAASDVFVFPSTVEAMSMMVLASDIVENTEVLPDAAWTFRAGDASDLVRAYREFKAETREAVEARCAGRVGLVRERYSWDGIADAYDAAYREALSLRRGKAVPR